MVQDELAPIVPPPVKFPSVTLVLVFEIGPPHCGVAGVPTTVMLVGRVSVNLTSVNGMLRRFVRVMVTVAGLPAISVAGEKVLVPVSAVWTVRLAETSAGFEPPLSEVRSPAAMVLE